MTLWRVNRAPHDGGGAGPTDADFIDRVIRERYHVDRQVGRGPLGSVFRAEDLEEGRPVAVKIFHGDIHPEGDEARGLLADLETAASLLNPHLMPTLDAGIVRGRLFIVEPLLAGQSLAARLADGPMSPVDTVRIALEVLVALDALHRHHVLHLDLHPDNIFAVRDPHGIERVLVGGVGQQHLLGLDRAPLRASGRTRARPSHLAPEIVSGKPRDMRTDLYQMGLVMYEALTGRPPFVGRDPATVARRHALERPPSPKNVRDDDAVSDGLDVVVVQCLEKVPRKRFASAMDMTRALEKVARKDASGPVSGRFRAVSLSAPPPRGRRPSTGPLGGRRPGTGPLGSMDEPPPFADFDHEPPPAGPRTQLDVRELLSAPPKMAERPTFGGGLPSPTDSGPAVTAPDRRPRTTSPIGSGDVEPSTEPPPKVEAPLLGQAGQTLVDPLYRPPLKRVSAPEEDDADDTGDLGGAFPGAALVGTEEDLKGIDTAETRAATAELPGQMTVPYAGLPGDADEMGRTAFDGGAASKQAASAVAAAEAEARARKAAAEKAAVAAMAKTGADADRDAIDGPDTGVGPAVASDGPSQIGAAPKGSDEGWSVDGSAEIDDIRAPARERSLLPVFIGALAVIAAVVIFVLPGGSPPPAAPDAGSTPVAVTPPPAPPPAAKPDAAAPAPEVQQNPLEGLEAKARSALGTRRWQGGDDALAETLGAMREIDPRSPAVTELSTKGAEALLTESRTALSAANYDVATARARTALAVAPTFAPALRLLREIDQARAADAEKAKADEEKAKADAEKAKADAEKAKADEEKRAEREKAAADRRAEAEARRKKATPGDEDRPDDAAAREERRARAAERKAREEAERRRREEEKAAEDARKAEARQGREASQAESKALLATGRKHVAAGRWDEAKAAFEASLAKRNNAAAHAGLGDVAFQQQRFADAVTHHRRAVKSGRGNADYLVNLGMAYFKLNNYTQAKASWEKALEIRPGHPKATRYMGVVKKKMGQSDAP